MTQVGEIKNIRISKFFHKKAKIIALMLDLSLKEYIEKLIDEDYKEVTEK